MFSTTAGDPMSRAHAHFVFWMSLALLLGAPALADVQVGQVDGKGGLRVNGGAGKDDVTITQNKNGTITVKGNGTTKVNGGKSHTTGKKVTGKLKVNLRGGDDNVEVRGLSGPKDVEVKDELGKNNITVKKTKVKGKLKVKNEDGKIDLDDVQWGKRDIRKGKGTVNPKNAEGKGGAGSAPPRGSGKKAARKKAAGAAKKKAPLNAQDQGLPTSNPGQRGLLPDIPSIPEIPSHPTPPLGGSKGKSYGPGSSYGGKK